MWKDRYDFNRKVSLIESTLHQATSAEWDEGSYWYENTWDVCCTIGCQTGYPTRLVAAVTAILSPGCEFNSNLIQAHAFLSCNKGVSITTYRRNIVKATELVANFTDSMGEGDLEDYIRGERGIGSPKTAAFYNGIIYKGFGDCVAIDVHMVRGLGLTYKDIDSYGKYRRWERAFVEVGRHVLTPQKIQAIIWLHQKNKSNKQED